MISFLKYRLSARCRFISVYCKRFFAIAVLWLLTASVTLGEIEFTSISPVSNGLKIVVSFDSQVTNLDLFSCADIPVWNWNHLMKTNLTELTNGILSWVETNLSSEGFFVGADADVDTDAEGVYDGFEIYVYQTDADDPDSDDDGIDDGYEIYVYETDANDPDSDDDGIDDFHDPEPVASNDFVTLSSVSFSGSGNHIVQADSQTTNFNAPQYLDSNLDKDANDPTDRFYPICYTRNSTMRMGAEFVIDPVPSGIVFTVKGNGPGTLDIPATTATLAGDTITMTATDTTNSLANEIDLMDSMIIDWSISYDEGTNWYSAGLSSNLLYVTWDDPVQTNPIQTFLHVGCESSDGENGMVGTNDDAVLSNVWAKLQTKDIHRASDNTPLSYYGFYDVNSNGVWNEGIDVDKNSSSSCTVTTAEGLVAEANGQCHSWITLMNEVMKAQGLDSVNGATNMRVGLITIASNSSFAVKYWVKSGTNSPRNIIDFYAGMEGTNITWPWVNGQASDYAGASGQGNSPNPPSTFQNHWIVKMNDKCYDPCYCIGPFVDFKEYEDAAFSGSLSNVNPYFLFDMPANNGSATNHDDEICDYLELDYE